MSITIRKAVEEDFQSVLFLIKQLAEFEKAANDVTNSVELMKSEKDYFQCFVAETEEKEIIGIALYFFAYYTWVGKSLYLEDIFVKQSYRGKNIGSALMEKIIETAKTENCKRIRWQVLKWNTSAIALYKKFGADIDEQWFNCTVNHKSISNFIIKD